MDEVAIGIILGVTLGSLMVLAFWGMVYQLYLYFLDYKGDPDEDLFKSSESTPTYCLGCQNLDKKEAEEEEIKLEDSLDYSKEEAVHGSVKSRRRSSNNP